MLCGSEGSAEPGGGLVIFLSSTRRASFFFDIVGLPLDALPWELCLGMLSLGLRRQLGRQWALDVSFAEDIVVESAPDIIFHASLHFRP